MTLSKTNKKNKHINNKSEQMNEESIKEFITEYMQKELAYVISNYPDIRRLYIDYKELERFDYELADFLIKKPDKFIEEAERVIKETRFEGQKAKIHVRIKNLRGAEKQLIENIKSKEIGQLIAFKGTLSRRGEVLYKTEIASYKCKLCGEEYKYPVTRNFVPPKKCESCGKLALVPLEEKSTYMDIQRAEVQELVERVKGSTNPAKIEILLTDDLVNTVSPGENVYVTGILRIREPLSTRQKKEMIYTKYIEVSSIESTKKDFEEIDISKEDEKKILDLAKSPNIIDRIVESIAPNIFGYRDVKYAIALQLFGGTKGKILRGRAKARDDIHVLLIGDPGIAKTRFLQSAVKIAPKSIYVSGKTVSGVGLTASAERDELSDGGWTLKAGALVLASGGMVAIDEFDKIDDADRASLHEVMESQTVSVAKAGIVSKLKAKTAIIAAANPKYGRFDQKKPVAEQFNIPPSLLSRFDLIFPIFDVLDEEKDERLAEHILTLHMESEEEKEMKMQEVIDPELLRKYIAYARKNIRPRLTRPAAERIKKFYLDLRKMGKDSGTVAITARYLEGLVRLAEANAKMRLSDTVELSDAETAVNLMNEVMKKVLTDRETNRIDIDLIATGKPRSEVQKMTRIYDIIKDLEKEEGFAEKKRIIEEAEREGISEMIAEKAINEFKRNGDIYEFELGKYKVAKEDEY